MLIFLPDPNAVGSCDTRRSTCFSSRPNKSDALSCSRTCRRASSPDAPQLRARSYSSSRCCESSSTISASRTGDNWSSARRALISPLKSSMLNPGDQVDSFHELTPAGALLRKHVFARGRQAIVAAPALTRLFNPAATDPVPFLKSIKQRIKGGDVESNRAARTQLDQLANLVSVSGTIFQQGQNHQFGAPFLEFAIWNWRCHILQCHIVTKHCCQLRTTDDFTDGDRRGRRDESNQETRKAGHSGTRSRRTRSAGFAGRATAPVGAARSACRGLRALPTCTRLQHSR